MDQMGILDKQGATPLYVQLSDYLIDEIQRGDLVVNAMIPSERNLMTQFDLSRATVRQALDRIEKMGYLRKVHGKGSFITLPGIMNNIGSYTDFVEEMRAMGRRGTTEVLFFRIILCTPKLAAILGLAADKDYVFKFIRLHCADKEPVLLETTYLPYGLFEGLDKADIAKAPLTEVLTVWYRKPITSSQESYQVTSLDQEEAALLAATPGDPAMHKQRVSFCGEQAIEYSSCISPKNRLVFHVLIQNGLEKR